MRRSLPLGIHVPGTTVWHRMPVGPKLTALVVTSIVVVGLPGPWPACAALVVALGLAAWAGVPARTVAWGIRPLVVVLVVLAAFQWWQRGWPTAVEGVATTRALVVAATTVTPTTPMDAFRDTIVRFDTVTGERLRITLTGPRCSTRSCAAWGRSGGSASTPTRSRSPFR